jgi:hypothetical protein
MTKEAKDNRCRRFILIPLTVAASLDDQSGPPQQAAIRPILDGGIAAPIGTDT